MTIRILSIAMFGAVLLASYQNCSLHESEGRKQLESILTRESADGSCAPFLFVNQLINYFDEHGPGELRDRRVGQQCLVTSVLPLDVSVIPDGEFESYSCSLTQDLSVQDISLPAAEIGDFGSPLLGNVYTLNPSTQAIAAVASTASAAASLTEFGFAIASPSNTALVDYYFVSKSGSIQYKCQTAQVMTRQNFESTANAQFRNGVTKRAGGIVFELNLEQ